jgi:hypothetical protein
VAALFFAMSTFSDLWETYVQPQQLATFGQTVTYDPQSGSAVEITGIWDTSEGGRVEKQTAGSLWVLIDDLPAGFAKLDTVTIDSVVYVVHNEPLQDRDGRGGTWLRLRKQ